MLDYHYEEIDLFWLNKMLETSDCVGSVLRRGQVEKKLQYAANIIFTVRTCHAIGRFGPRTMQCRNKCTITASFTINLSHFILIKTTCKDIIEQGSSFTSGLLWAHKQELSM